MTKVGVRNCTDPAALVPPRAHALQRTHTAEKYELEARDLLPGRTAGANGDIVGRGEEPEDLSEEVACPSVVILRMVVAVLRRGQFAGARRKITGHQPLQAVSGVRLVTAQKRDVNATGG